MIKVSIVAATNGKVSCGIFNSKKTMESSEEIRIAIKGQIQSLICFPEKTITQSTALKLNKP